MTSTRRCPCHLTTGRFMPSFDGQGKALPDDVSSQPDEPDLFQPFSHSSTVTSDVYTHEIRNQTLSEIFPSFPAGATPSLTPSLTPTDSDLDFNYTPIDSSPFLGSTGIQRFLSSKLDDLLNSISYPSPIVPSSPISASDQHSRSPSPVNLNSASGASSRRPHSYKD